MTKSDLKYRAEELATEWTGSYSADRYGSEVSVEIIRAMLALGIPELAARMVYFSKHMRWFYDRNEDVTKRNARDRFTAYIQANRNDISHDLKEWSTPPQYHAVIASQGYQPNVIFRSAPFKDQAEAEKMAASLKLGIQPGYEAKVEIVPSPLLKAAA